MTDELAPEKSIDTSETTPNEPVGEASPPRRTLADLLAEFTAIERSLDNPDFDPAAIVGDLKNDIATKVDAIEYVAREYAEYAKRTTARAKRMMDRAQSAASRAEALLDYVRVTMLSSGMTRLTGTDKYFEIGQGRERADVMRPPTAVDHLKYGHLVRRTEPAFAWNKDEIKRAIKSGATYDFARIVREPTLIVDDRDRLDLPTDSKKKGKAK